MKYYTLLNFSKLVCEGVYDLNKLNINSILPNQCHSMKVHSILATVTLILYCGGATLLLFSLVQ